MMGLSMKSETGEMRTAQISELYQRRLLNYADSFFELARSYDREDLTNKSEEDRQKVLEEKRLWESRQVLQCHLKEAGRIMTEVACEIMCYRPAEPRKARRIVNMLKGEGITADNPCIIVRDDGQEALAILLRTQKKGNISSEEVADMLSVLLNRRLQVSFCSPLTVNEEIHNFLFEEEPVYTALTGFARVAREGEEISGDNYAVLEPGKGRLAVMISDGTGFGEQAGKDSEQVLELMEKFLEAGCSADTAMETVNNAFFVLGGDDNHPTLDLCEIDLYRGDCVLRKVGGAVSFLKRGNQVECLKEDNLPLGIFRQPSYEPILRHMQEGDYILMVSDGVADAFDGQNYETTLCGMIADMTEQNPGELAKKLLRAAIIVGGGHIRDDMTVGVAGIWRTK